jgi:hypothetical protein
VKMKETYFFALYGNLQLRLKWKEVMVENLFIQMYLVATLSFEIVCYIDMHSYVL